MSGGPNMTGGSGTATLSWASPTQRTDGSALNNLAGFRIRYGTSSGAYSRQVTLKNPGLTRYVVDGLPPGTYYFVVSALDANGLESSASNEASKTIE